jgi:hypothetical protein
VVSASGSVTWADLATAVQPGAQTRASELFAASRLGGAPVDGDTGGEALTAELTAARGLATGYGIDSGRRLSCDGGPTRLALLLAIASGATLSVDAAATDRDQEDAPDRDVSVLPAAAVAGHRGRSRVAVVLADDVPAPPDLLSLADEVVVVYRPADGCLLATRIRVDEDRYVIGRALPGGQVRVLDRAGRPVLPTAVGQLHCGPPPGAPVGWRVHQLADGRLAPAGRMIELAAPRPDAAPAAVSTTGPEVEQTLLRLWGEALERDDIGPEDDFFVLGGHSLLGATLVARIREELGCDLALGDFFRAPTIRELADTLSSGPGVDDPAGSGDGAPPEVPVEILERVEQMSDEEVAEMLRDNRRPA